MAAMASLYSHSGRSESNRRDSASETGVILLDHARDTIVKTL